LLPAGETFGSFHHLCRILLVSNCFSRREGSIRPQLGRSGGFGSRVVELIDDFDGDTYRAVYTVRFESAVYVLHAFKKKSKRGIATPKSESALIERRLRVADADNSERVK
jgi:hypothetical protein